MRVAIAICIIFVVINSVYSEDSSNKDSSLSRETRDASPARRKDSKSTRKEKKTQRKLKKKKNEGKSKRSKNSKNVNKEKKRKTKKAQRKKKSKNVNKAKKKKAIRAQKKKSKTKKKKGKGKKRSQQGQRKTKKRDRKGKKKVKFNKKKTNNIKSHNKVNQERNTTQDNSSSNETSDLPKKLKCPPENPPETKVVNNFKQNRRFYDKYNLLKNKLDKISVFTKFKSVLGKLTNDGTTCTEAAREGYLLMSACESSAATACNKTKFESTYYKAIGCVETINCNTTKVPTECKNKEELDKLVNKTRECTNKKLLGTFSYCMNYVKENVSTDISECLDETPTTTPATVTDPAPTSEPDLVETTLIFTEGDEVVEQKESYNPDTKELTLSVPAHGNNVALTAIIGVDQMVTSYDNYCVLGDPPADHTTEVNENSESTDDADELDSNSIDKVYTFNVVEKDLTDAERAELPESFQTACKGKPIQKSKQIVVDEATYNQNSLDSVDDSRIISRQGGDCINQSTSCNKFDGGCAFLWTNPSGGIVRVHGLSKTVHCLSCCEEKSTSSLCQCSKITSSGYNNAQQAETSWKSCYKKTNGDCDFNGWKCNDTDTCLEYSEQCDGECYGTLNKCGDKCVVPLSSDRPCQEKCINNSVQCEGECPASAPVVCGDRCLTNSTAQYYYECDGQCISKGRSCNGVCPPGRVDCNGYCYTQIYFDLYLWKCGEKCLWKFQQCNGTCPDERTKCGNNMCLCSDDDPRCWTNSKYYRDCDGTCISNRQPCDKACVSGYNFCNYTYSYTYPDGTLYSYNRDICAPADYFPKYYQYCGDCDQCTRSRLKCPPHESSTCPVEPPGEQPILLTSPSTSSTSTPVVVTPAGRKRRFYQ